MKVHAVIQTYASILESKDHVSFFQNEQGKRERKKIRNEYTGMKYVLDILSIEVYDFSTILLCF